MRRELKKALTLLARAVRATMNLHDLPDARPVETYHAREYTDAMTDLLLEQLLTATDDPGERARILLDAGLDSLVEELELKAAEWETE